MPRYSRQKLKLLYLLDIFKKHSSEDHPLTLAEIAEKLAENGIESERKSLYDDMDALTSFGCTIEKTGSGRKTAYYLSEREFELPELKLLADAVACSKFLTANKSGKLIKKLSSLADTYSAGELSRAVIVHNRVKTSNEHIYYNVDVIQKAIRDKSKINFLYFGYDEKKNKVYHNEGRRSEISPYALCWEDENYYVVGFYPKYNKISNFRVDKIEKAVISTDENGKAVKAVPPPADFKISEYTKRVFGMFSGDMETVKLRVNNSLSGVMIDRFGKDVMLIPDGDDHFTISQTVSRSRIFYGWLFQFGSSVEIISPENVRQEYIDYIKELGKLYNV